jgi:hypothetical protein
MVNGWLMASPPEARQAYSRALFPKEFVEELLEGLFSRSIGLAHGWKMNW